MKLKVFFTFTANSITGLFAIFAALLLSQVGCNNETITEPAPDPDTMTVDTNDIRYLALGDSYTIGESVAETERFPVQLAGRLQAGGMPVSEVKIVARTGWTTDELQAGIGAATLAPPYDLVTLLIGVNNQYRGYSLEAYRQTFTTLLQQAVVFAGSDKNRVIVVSIPDYAVTPFGQNSSDPARISMEIDEFNAANRTIAEAQGVHYVDITPISREAVDNPALVANDGLHPSGLMYARWVELLEPVTKEILAN